MSDMKFRPANDMQKHEWRRLQAGHTHIDGNAIGLCYLHHGMEHVMPTNLDVCVDCALKKGKEAVLKMVNATYTDYCYVCGTYRRKHPEYNLLTLNVRLCRKCAAKVARKSVELRSVGVYEKHPMYHNLQRMYGKDWRVLSGLAGDLTQSQQLLEYAKSLINVRRV